jgi:hypothetical protein
MIGGIEETSASFEARYAPRSYPTVDASRKRSPDELAGCAIRRDPQATSGYDRPWFTIVAISSGAVRSSSG